MRKIIQVLPALLLILNPVLLDACSTFKLQKGNKLIYAHNLNEGDLGVPGMVFINKRGVFKLGRTWSELTTARWENPSKHSWVSRYGSVTFNTFGRDFPDGGMNEAGLFIWEMNEDPEYPTDTGKPKLDQMNWMQYVLDNFTTAEQAVKSASVIEISGWGWHFFVGDANGNCAAITFVDGKALVNSGKSMPVPALFNTPYDREMEVASYFNGFGGLYEVDMTDPQVPRFVKTATLIKKYSTSENIVDYGFGMLDSIAVFDKPEWSILFNVRSNEVYYRTRISPRIKKLTLDRLDFTNTNPLQILDMDAEVYGEVREELHFYSNREMKEFLGTKVLPILGEEFFTVGGISAEEFLDRMSSHCDDAALEEKQFFKGSWEDVESGLSLTLDTREDRVSGTVSNSKDIYPMDHLHMAGRALNFTFKTKGNRFMEVDAIFDKDRMKIQVRTTEENAGTYELIRTGT